ncbi:MAG: glycine-rich domain-containing protein [Rivularia sp. (in: cyanobacteria)]
MNIVTFFDRVNNLDLRAVEKKLISSTGWTLEKTQVAISRYKLFLYIKSVYPTAILVPTQEIDAVWHTHIEVNLLKYIQDSDYLFGYILNHCSAVDGEQNEKTLQIYQQAFSLTKALFEEFFGVGILENTSSNIAACADIPIDTNPAPCTFLPINANTAY